MSGPRPQQPPKQSFFERTISKRAAAAILIVVTILAVVIVVATPRLLERMFPKPSPEFVIISKSEEWTKEEIPDGIGGDLVMHVKVAVKNYGDAAGVCILNVKVEEPGGRFWLRYRFMSISPGETVEEQVDFLEVLDQNVEYTAWLIFP